MEGKKYAKYIIENIATYSLFGTSKATSIDDSYVKVNITEDIERERYKEKHKIETLLKNSKRGNYDSEYRYGKAREAFRGY